MLKPLPSSKGSYRIRVSDSRGNIHTLEAWYNPASGHWIINGKECGFQRDIQLPHDDAEGKLIEVIGPVPEDDFLLCKIGYNGSTDACESCQ